MIERVQNLIPAQRDTNGHRVWKAAEMRSAIEAFNTLHHGNAFSEAD
jgi:hypothetical protein